MRPNTFTFIACFILHVVTRMATTEANQKPVKTLDGKETFLKVHEEKKSNIMLGRYDMCEKSLRASKGISQLSVSKVRLRLNL